MLTVVPSVLLDTNYDLEDVASNGSLSAAGSCTDLLITKSASTRKVSE